MMDRKKLEEAILAKAKEGKIPCASCLRLRKTLVFRRQEMGKILNQMKIKIGHCQLGML